jgi:hypothetical protein
MRRPWHREVLMATAEDSKEFRQNAQDCLQWARDAKTDEERKAFVDMARTWMQAATKAEGMVIPVADELPTPKTH